VNNQKEKNYFATLIKKAEKTINLAVGNTEILSTEDRGGALRFDPSGMLRLDIIMDKDFLPHEKVVKLNMRGPRFFKNLKQNIHTINSVYIVYPKEYEIRFDTREPEWNSRLVSELNSEYNLDLHKILFVSEEEVIRKYLQNGFQAFQNPYNLDKGHLLLIAGGFANFDFKSKPIATIRAELVIESKGKDGKPLISKKSYESNYYNKFNEKAGAYFYTGGDWFHNLFINELFHPGASRYFFFRISDDRKTLKFFGDPQKPGVEIFSDLQVLSEPGREIAIYKISPKYLEIPRILDFKLSVVIPIARDMTATRIEPPEVSSTILAVPEPPYNETHPYLENEMHLLPLPQKDDIASYVLTVGDAKKNIKFYTGSFDNEVSILANSGEQLIYKKKIGDVIDYKVQLDHIYYSISNTFISRVNDPVLPLYFGWELRTNANEKIDLTEDFYIIGRSPLSQSPDSITVSSSDRLLRLNRGEEELWRIGTSRDHAFLLKKEGKYYLYNISFHYPVYLFKSRDQESLHVRLQRIEPISDSSSGTRLNSFLSRIRVILSNEPHCSYSTDSLAEELSSFARSALLESNDLVITGNRVFRYIVPLSMDSKIS